MDEIVSEAERLVSLGVKELNLVAQETSAYGRDLGGGIDLAALIGALDQVPGVLADSRRGPLGSMLSSSKLEESRPEVLLVNARSLW